MLIGTYNEHQQRNVPICTAYHSLHCDHIRSLTDTAGRTAHELAGQESSKLLLDGPEFGGMCHSIPPTLQPNVLQCSLIQCSLAPPSSDTRDHRVILFLRLLLEIRLRVCWWFPFVQNMFALLVYTTRFGLKVGNRIRKTWCCSVCTVCFM